jgi:hypothetical protein
MVLETCVGGASGHVHFQLERHSIHAHVIYPEDVDSQRPEGSTRLLALDDLVSSGDAPPPDVIKIDVEGYEYNVLQGAQTLIETYRPHIVFELSDTTPRYRRKPRDFFDFFLDVGLYSFEVAVGSYRDAVRIDDLDAFDRKFCEKPYLTNILARSEIRSRER